MFRSLLLLSLIAPPLWAQTPRVATDIAPVQSLVASVMGDLGTPDLIVTPGASPHGFALRPSQARALQEADLVVWVGHTLTPWLEKPLDTLAPGAVKLELLDLSVTLKRQVRDAVGDDHDHDAVEPHSDEEHGNAEGGHVESGHDQDEHHHEGTDPHAWLDPENGRVWLGEIADALAQIDPEHAEIYQNNADATAKQLDALNTQIATQLAPYVGKSFVTFHDAFQYFELRFGLTSAGAVSLGNAADPSPARVAHLREIVAEEGVTCAFREPQFNPKKLEVVTEGGGLIISALDPLGSTLTPGADLYQQMLQNIADAISDCMKDNG